MSIHSRREFIAQSGLAGLCLGTSSRCGVSADRPFSSIGYVVGEPTAETVGSKVLVEGGNAFDAIVAAAFAAAVAAPNQTGIGGYGMSAIFAVDSGRRIVAIDGNSAAPAAMQADTFSSIADGTDKRRTNEYGWLAAGVPGIMAGLQLAIDRFGTRSLSELIQPAISIAREGYRWPTNLAGIIRGNPAFANDPGSRKLYFRDGKPLPAGEIFKNLELAELLESLANANSVEAFYRGDIAQRIADAFQMNGGIVTAKDLATYEARLVEPLTMSWNGLQIHTPALTSGGLTVLQILNSLKAMQWNKLASGIEQLHAKIEASRLAWHDRLTLLGDPNFVSVPIEKLLSNEYAEQSAMKIKEAVKNATYLHYPVAAKPQGGTISLSAADRNGNLAALTLTHGEAFGSKVSVEGLGLTLGHGMSRFDPRPNHPNAPGPGKRPLHNMVPTTVTRSGQCVMAIGGRGGRKIVNAILEMLVQFVGLEQPMTKSMEAHRFHTEGDARVSFEKTWPPDTLDEIAKLGYSVKTEGSATLSAVAIENGRTIAAMR